MKHAVERGMFMFHDIFSCHGHIMMDNNYLVLDLKKTFLCSAITNVNGWVDRLDVEHSFKFMNARQVTLT